MTDGVGVRTRVSPAGLRLRRVEPADIPAVAHLLADLGYAGLDPDALERTLRAALVSPDLALCLAVAGDEPVGFMQLSRRPQPQLAGTLVSIDTLVVAACARGRGIGGRLLRRARAYARGSRAVRIEVHTSRARENYRRGFYPAHGYREAHSALFRLHDLETAHGLGPHLPHAGQTGPAGATYRHPAAAHHAPPDAPRLTGSGSAPSSTSSEEQQHD